MLKEFIRAQRSTVLDRTRAKVAERTAPRPTEEELEKGVPLFLDQLVAALGRTNGSIAEISESAARHGADMLRLGFTVGQVVHIYGNICQAVTELAMEFDAAITADEFHTLNRCLDDAIAGAVSAHSSAGSSRWPGKGASVSRPSRTRCGTSSTQGCSPSRPSRRGAWASAGARAPCSAAAWKT
jgi:hypothetical protein